MFEHFTEDARHAVRLAQEEARRLRHGFIGPEHLLLGLSAQRAGPAGEALAAAGLEITCLRDRIMAEADDPLDAAALASLGIDLETVRRTTEAAFGPGALDRGRRRREKIAGHIPFEPDGKKALQLALREAVRLKHRHISAGHILLGILRGGNNAAVQILTGADVDIGALRDDTIRRLAAAA